MTGALWSAREIARVTGGEAGGRWSVVGVAIDSRTVQPGELFVALEGPRHDAHAFVGAALARGAAAMVARVPEGLGEGAPLVVVDDTLAALTALGRAGGARSRARSVAITGSVGKTGTKEALRLALAGQGTTHASAASHNNHWGVPLSLARLPPDADFGVFELGMNAPGEIRALARLVRPHVALITNVEAAHLGFFASLAAIAEAKAEIFAGLEAGGTAVLNADNPHFARLARLAEAAGCGAVLSFGEAVGAAVRLLEARCDAEGSEVTVGLGGTRLAYRIGAPGRHWVTNSLAVLAATMALGAAPETAAAALAEFRPPRGRGARHRIARGGGFVTVIDESYNANPASMRAALSLLEGLPGRRLAALGDMLELGAHARRLHAELAGPIAACGVDRVYTVGPEMRHLERALPPACRGAHVASAAELVAILDAELRPGDTLLVKGSLGIAMGQIVDALRAERRTPAVTGAAEG